MKRYTFRVTSLDGQQSTVTVDATLPEDAWIQAINYYTSINYVQGIRCLELFACTKR